MKCWKPVETWRSRRPTKNGKQKLVFKKNEGYGPSMLLPCGNCEGCLIARSNQWAVRIMHEATGYHQNSFVTLTYNQQNLPTIFDVPTIQLRDLQNFIKRYRKKYTFRYFAGSEYGSKTNRPHYHAVLFGHIPQNLVRLARKPTPNNLYPSKLYKSEELQKIWGNGFCSVGTLTFQSAAYTARYTMKKGFGEESLKKYKYAYNPICDHITRYGSKAYEFYRNDEDCVTFQVERERSVMSLKPGIGASWLEKYWSDISDDGFITVKKVIKGKIEFYSMRAPRYYLKWLEQHPMCTKQHQKFLNIKAHTEDYFSKHPDDWYGVNREPVLKTRKILAQQRAVQLPREISFESLEAIA